MFQSFTGNSRRPRQVNLSSRSSVNPFAAHSPSKRHPPSAHGSQATLAIAQQERLRRQLDRERLNSSRTIQRTWRGYIARKTTRASWRIEWDKYEQERNPGYRLPDCAAGRLTSGPPTQYPTASDCVRQLKILLAFIDASDQDDAVRLDYFSRAFQRTVEEMPSLLVEGEWAVLLSRLATTTLRVISTSRLGSPAFIIDDMLRLLMFLTKLVPRPMANKAREYYQVMATLTTSPWARSGDTNMTRGLITQAVLAILQPITSDTLEAYEWFARTYLTIPSLEDHLGSLNELAVGVNYKLLASVLDSHILQSQQFLSSNDTVGRIWLLAYFIFFHRHALGSTFSEQAPESLFVKAMSSLLSSVATDISQRIDVEEEDVSKGYNPLPPFVRYELLSLVNQNSITQLLSRAGVDGLPGMDDQAEDEAKSLATYALTLLRIFPRRGDEIRMWLYLGSASTTERGGLISSRMPAIKYFWNATKSTKVYRTVVERPGEILEMLKTPSTNGRGVADQPSTSWPGREQEWTIILLFLELYTFLLKVLDDEEFFSGGSLDGFVSNGNTSWTKESTLPLAEVKYLTIFLKNLAFTLYWSAADLASDEVETERVGIRDYFNASAVMLTQKSSNVKPKSKELGGVTGIPLEYFKGLVTGLLRMVHERDSRRKFLPDGHWLMTDRFDMEGFIPTVVAEEENRHQLQDDEESDLENEALEDDDLGHSLGLGVHLQRSNTETEGDILAKHHANIRRENLFEDAFEQFYPLGEGLKEPIPNTFIDKFDTVEAALTGGGRKALLRQAGVPERSAEWTQQIRELLNRYEFLGRVIGKCLYEGILVDVNFAGFFLLKWALTGGSSLASKESAYRANLNDIRDLDESLYQGLLQLKNYPGNVEDFSLNFTRLVGGDSGEIDVADLRRNTVYSGVYTLGDDMEEHMTVKLFWQVMESMPNTDRQKVLKFVTSTPRAPLLGFSHLNPRFSIRDSSSDEERLPSTSTCANLLKLPRYTSARTLHEKLMYAINSGAGFDLS
ncbi:E3 ubiquitin-protein ligase HUWE1 [Coccidioides immitis H538.4]|uniref:HECT-type E3 ubiquitin transferase n=1 Tax=Coccidioides immitis H538.4 TaxID=396776 RepID=A0A0J8RKH6_COCIT|nr:E3 ubiquitin-protein ligase HUWE1 [Coccidioides immitis H538.4]